MKTDPKFTKKKGKLRFGIAQNLNAAAAMSGLPLTVVQSLKDKGCHAFKPNRSINCDELVAAAAEAGLIGAAGAEVLDARIEKALDIRAGRLLKEQKLAERSRQLIPRQIVVASWSKSTINAKSKFYLCETTIPVEAQMALGLTPEQGNRLREIVKKHVRLVVREMFSGPWCEVVCACGAKLNPDSQVAIAPSTESTPAKIENLK